MGCEAKVKIKNSKREGLFSLRSGGGLVGGGKVDVYVGGGSQASFASRGGGVMKFKGWGYKQARNKKFFYLCSS